MYGDRVKRHLSMSEESNGAPPTREETGGRRGVAFPVVAVILAAAIAAAFWFGYPFLQKQSSALAEFPVLQKSFTALSDRMGQAEAGLRNWASEQQSLHERLGGVERRLQSARKQAQEIGDGIYRRLKLETETRAQGMETRLARLESSQQSEQERVASLQQELSQVKQEMEKQAAHLAAVQQGSESDRETVQKRLAGLQDGMDNNKREVTSLARSLEIKRIDFEVAKNRSTQLAPGISVRVTGTDVSRRQVNGWMWIMPDRKTIWLRGQGAQRPVIFYSKADGKRREVVFTDVRKDAAIGYLLLSADAESARTASTRIGEPANRSSE